jgi:hypothetical protein
MLTLFVRTPNGRLGVGNNRDAFLPNPSATSALELQMFEFVGAWCMRGLLFSVPIPGPLSPLSPSPPFFSLSRTHTHTDTPKRVRTFACAYNHLANHCSTCTLLNAHTSTSPTTSQCAHFLQANSWALLSGTRST